jgi:hypothetical protein
MTMRNVLAWLEYNWNWAFITFCAVLLILAAALAVAGVRHHRREREAADYDHELDVIEDAAGARSPLHAAMDAGYGPGDEVFDRAFWGDYYGQPGEPGDPSDLPGPVSVGADRAGELHHDDPRHPLHWPSIVAGLGPLERTRLEELTLTQRQAVRLEAWMASCRAGWDRARMEAAWAVAA